MAGTGSEARARSVSPGGGVQAKYADDDVAPGYGKEFEYNYEVGNFRDQVMRDNQELFELNDQLGEDSEEDKGLLLTQSDSEEEMLAAALSFAKRTPTFSSSPDGLPPRLERPVAVPQVRNGIGVPFTRAFTEALIPSDITEEEWLAFTDNLNVVATANPPLQVLDLAGMVIGFIPHEWAMPVSMAIGAVAQVGTYVVSKSRTDRFMTRANSEFFAPRGLKASLCTTEALHKILGLVPQDQKPRSRLPSIPFLKPSAHIGLAPVELSTMHLTVQERRFKVIEGRVAPLRFDVPPPAPQVTALRKICAWQVKRDAASAEKRVFRARKRKQEILRSQGLLPAMPSGSTPEKTPPAPEVKDSSASSDSAAQAQSGKASSFASSHAATIGIAALSMIVPLPKSMTSRYSERSDHARRRYEREVSRGRAGQAEARYNRDMQKIDRERSRELTRLDKDDKEEKAHGKIMWLLVENLDADPGRLDESAGGIEGLKGGD